MKAKRISTGEVVEVTEQTFTSMGTHIVHRQDKKTGVLIAESDLEFLPDTHEKVIEGWVAVDKWGMGGCFLHSTEPEAVAREFCDTGEYEVYWVSEGEKYELDSKLFPDMTPESEPKRVKITITPMER